MHIYLVRHCEYENPENIFAFHLPVYLSEKGRKDARKIGQDLKQRGIKNIPIYSSPMVRCVQTAEIIAGVTESAVKIDKRLIETSCPNLEGKKMPQEKRWVVEQEDPSRETKKQVITRMLSVLEEKINEGKDCILVSHGEPLTFLYWTLKQVKFLKYPWNPKLKGQIIQRGQVVDVEVKNDRVVKAEIAFSL